jgi:L-ascorbate metabolism protein UlaG (beta-lactamase superfamily)
MAELRWLGHAATELTMEGKKIVIDPFIRGNPICPVKFENYVNEKLDLIVVTHDHYDHLGDAPEIMRSNQRPRLLAVYDLEVHISSTYGISMDRMIQANVGGFIDFNGIKLALTKAVHSSEHGDPTGVVIRGEGITVYHAGDTGIFEDMRLISEIFKPDYALLPIGGRFTMDPEQAIIAAEMIKPRKGVIPIHFNTWPAISVDETVFQQTSKSKGLNPILLKPGQSIKL